MLTLTQQTSTAADCQTQNAARAQRIWAQKRTQQAGAVALFSSLISSAKGSCRLRREKLVGADAANSAQIRAIATDENFKPVSVAVTASSKLLRVRSKLTLGKRLAASRKFQPRVPCKGAQQLRSSSVTLSFSSLSSQSVRQNRPTQTTRSDRVACILTWHRRARSCRTHPHGICHAL